MSRCHIRFLVSPMFSRYGHFGHICELIRRQLVVSSIANIVACCETHPLRTHYNISLTPSWAWFSGHVRTGFDWLTGYNARDARYCELPAMFVKFMCMINRNVTLRDIAMKLHALRTTMLATWITFDQLCSRIENPSTFRLTAVHTRAICFLRRAIHFLNLLLFADLWNGDVSLW